MKFQTKAKAKSKAATNNDTCKQTEIYEQKIRREKMDMPPGTNVMILEIFSPKIFVLLVQITCTASLRKQ
jgi:hypothetical protein